MAKRRRATPSKGPGLWLAGLAAILIAAIASAVWLGKPTEAVVGADIVVYKSPSCRCCSKWVDHLSSSGLVVDVRNVSSTRPTQIKYGVPSHLGSCHTAVVGNYWVEGHVPADLVKKLMIERPSDIKGISVPGMPIGSPGMEGANPQVYAVMAYQHDGQTRVYATREGRSEP